jgi:hypothetical protein
MRKWDERSYPVSRGEPAEILPHTTGESGWLACLRTPFGVLVFERES